MNFNLPQFGVQVLSESRKRMNAIVDFCNNSNIPIYSIKTDSFVIDSSNVNKFAEKYELAGGALTNVARYAALCAAQENRRKICNDDIIRALAKELHKEGKIL